MAIIEINKGYDTDAQLLALLQSKIPEDWQVEIVFKSMKDESTDKFNYEPIFYNGGRYYSNGEMIYIEAHLKRYGTNTYVVVDSQLKRLREIFNRVQYAATVEPETVLKFDEHGLMEKNKERWDDEWGNTCSNHEHSTRPGYHRYLVEQDSFGSEYANHCWSCDERSKGYTLVTELCPQLWETCRCGNKQPSLVSYRDPDEGSNGPVYERCDACHKRFWDNWYRENEADDDYYD